MSISKDAIEAAARAIYDVRDDPYDDDEWEEMDSADREECICQARAALTSAAPFIQAAAIAEASAYLERIHPSGLTPTKAVLADLAVVENRMGRGRHANGNDRIAP